MMKKRSLLLGICAVLFFSCPNTAIKSTYTGVYPYVYCEDNFNFQKAGELKGSFTLSRYTDFTRLDFQIVVPRLFWFSKIYEFGWNGYVKIPAKIVFEWTGSDGKKKKAETTLFNKDSIVIIGSAGFNYVPLPYGKKIHYTLSYEAGEYVPRFGYKGLAYTEEDGTQTDHTDKIKANPEQYPDFWKGQFIVCQRDTPGLPVESQKPARD